MNVSHLYRVVERPAGEPEQRYTIEIKGTDGNLTSVDRIAPSTERTVYGIECRVCGENVFVTKLQEVSDLQDAVNLLLSIPEKYPDHHDVHARCIADAEAECEDFRRGRIK
jgi:hypothetical protein